MNRLCSRLRAQYLPCPTLSVEPTFGLRSPAVSGSRAASATRAGQGSKSISVQQPRQNGSRPLVMSATQGRTALEETSDKGEFKRKDSTFRDWVKPGGRFEPEGMRSSTASTCPHVSVCAANRWPNGPRDTVSVPPHLRQIVSSCLSQRYSPQVLQNVD